MDLEFILIDCKSGEILRAYAPLNMKVSIGRAPYNHICIDDPTVSVTHCAVINSEEGVLMQDKDSRNGTSVNDRVLKPDEPVPLRDGDVVRIAHCLYIFRCMQKRGTDI